MWPRNFRQHWKPTIQILMPNCRDLLPRTWESKLSSRISICWCHSWLLKCRLHVLHIRSHHRNYHEHSSCSNRSAFLRFECLHSCIWGPFPGDSSSMWRCCWMCLSNRHWPEDLADCMAWPGALWKNYLLDSFIFAKISKLPLPAFKISSATKDPKNLSNTRKIRII